MSESNTNKKSLFSFEELEDKIKGAIFGLFGSIIASFSVALGVSVLTPNVWTILISGLIVGIASSFANAFGPLVTKGRLLSSQVYSVSDLIHSITSFILTFIIVGLPIIPYLIEDMAIARIVSIITGLVLLFIFGVHKGQLEHLEYESLLLYGFKMALIGATGAIICYLAAFYFIK